MTLPHTYFGCAALSSFAASVETKPFLQICSLYPKLCSTAGERHERSCSGCC
jgi:hypothetical protein